MIRFRHHRQHVGKWDDTKHSKHNNTSLHTCKTEAQNPHNIVNSAGCKIETHKFWKVVFLAASKPKTFYFSVNLESFLINYEIFHIQIFFFFDI